MIYVDYMSQFNLVVAVLDGGEVGCWRFLFGGVKSGVELAVA